MTSSGVKSLVGRSGTSLNYRMEDRVVDSYMPSKAREARVEVEDKYGPDILSCKKAAWNQSTWQPTASQEKCTQGATDLLLSNTKSGQQVTSAGDHVNYRESFSTLGSTRNRTITFGKPEVPDPWSPLTTLDKKGLQKELEKTTKTALNSTLGVARGLEEYNSPQRRQEISMASMRATKKGERQKMRDLEAVFGEEGARVVAGFEGQPLKMWQRPRATKEDLEAVRALDDWVVPAGNPSP